LKINYKVEQQVKKWGYEVAQEERQGALLDWTPEVAEELRGIFDNDLEYLLHNDYFLGLKSEPDSIYHDIPSNCLYNSHKDDILAIYEENKKRPINLVILIEGIGSGKTTLYSVMTWLEHVRLTAKFNPHAYYGLLNDEIIAFIAMNRSETQAKKVTLQKVFPKFNTQFNLEFFPPSKRRGQEIWIPRNNTLIFAGTSSAASALGYNIYGGGVDEANFLEVTEGGKKGQSVTEVYDAAEEMHNAIVGRQKSRFLNPRTGLLDGMLFMISSSRYPDDYLEKKAREHLKLGKDSHIYVRRRTLWEAKPKFYFSGVTFKFDINSRRILNNQEEIEILKNQAAEEMAIREKIRAERRLKELSKKLKVLENS
jgi:hypothetical protein